MNTVSASVLAGFAALVTVWALKPDDAGVVSEAAPLITGSAFLEDRYFQVAADGSCATRSDVDESLVGGGETEVATAAPVEADAAGQTMETPPPPPPSAETPAPVPVGGSCGGHPLGQEGDADAAVDAGGPEPVPEAQAAPVATAPSKPVAEPVAAPKPKAKSESAPVRAASSASKARPVQPPREPLTAWWPARKADALNVLFVGEASFGSAITVLTDGQFDSADNANSNIQVRTADGKAVNGRWQVATNRQMLLMLVKPGVYTVSIEPDLADGKGRQVGSESSGQVYVR